VYLSGLQTKSVNTKKNQIYFGKVERNRERAENILYVKVEELSQLRGEA